jgi:hypothetical protein
MAWIAAIVTCWGVNNGLRAQTADPTLELLVRKGIITQEEADKTRAEAHSMRSNAPPALPNLVSKWNINKAIKNVELFGDIRLRYEGRTATDPGGGSIDLRRYRYALRLGLRGEIYDNFYYGVRLETAANPRSPWVTFGSSSSGTPYQGPFGKSTAGINVGQIYLGWRPTDWLDVTAGKMPQPLYTTPMVWDTDLNPEGLAEHLKYTIGPVDLFGNFGQYLYEDVTPAQTAPGYFNILGYNNATPPLLLAWQLGFNYHVTEGLSVKTAPAVYNYTGHGVSAANAFNNPTPDFNGIFVGQGSTIGLLSGSPYFNLANGQSLPADGFFANETGINNLLILDIPWEVNYKLDRVNLRLFGDYAQNLDGAERAQAAFDASQNTTLFPSTSGLIRIPSPQRNDVHAYQVGFAIGNRDSLGTVYGTTSRKHGWEFRTYWQHVEQYALDPNLLDSDFFEGRGNMQGIYSAFAYCFTDNLIATIRYGYAKRINQNLGTGGSNQDIPQMNPIKQYDVVQVDLGFRF